MRVKATLMSLSRMPPATRTKSSQPSLHPRMASTMSSIQRLKLDCTPSSLILAGNKFQAAHSVSKSRQLLMQRPCMLRAEVSSHVVFELNSVQNLKFTRRVLEQLRSKFKSLVQVIFCLTIQYSSPRRH